MKTSQSASKKRSSKADSLTSSASTYPCFCRQCSAFFAALPVSIREHASAYVSIRLRLSPMQRLLRSLAFQHTSAYVSIRQPCLSTYVSIRQPCLSANVSIRLRLSPMQRPLRSLACQLRSTKRQVSGLKPLVYEAFSYQCMRLSATSVRAT